MLALPLSSEFLNFQLIFNDSAWNKILEGDIVGEGVGLTQLELLSSVPTVEVNTSRLSKQPSFR